MSERDQSATTDGEPSIQVDGNREPVGHETQPILTAGAPARGAEIALVLLHGRGATGQGVINLFEPLYRHGVTVLAPEAYRGRWFPRSPTAPLEANEPWLPSSVDRVETCLERMQRIGIPPEKTVVVGFSQGACVVATWAFHHPRRYGAVGVLSGVLPGVVAENGEVELEKHHSEEGVGSLENTSVYVGCGADDPHLSLEDVEATADALEMAGGAVELEITHETGHAVSEEAFAWLESVIDRLVEA
ncbi:alpha/beta hydrolase-fold protein [Halobacteria archaeon AArc-curdl1]|uniref:Alpha/beta hydrolase-fold protein n=1 Tax=Natronosalvus hydrolyticus TaxID=2979988 RepID=A0AAP2Z8K4_9EURY|nr:alpha/beta hydrolase-fold protein [Halobacteria archaeon AArc-curdl1]